MKITTHTGIVCPGCNKNLDITTSGIFGGIIVQFVVRAMIQKIARDGGNVECGQCGHKWTIESAQTRLRHRLLGIRKG